MACKYNIPDQLASCHFKRSFSPGCLHYLRYFLLSVRRKILLTPVPRKVSRGEDFARFVLPVGIQYFVIS